MTHGPCGSEKPNAPCNGQEKKRCTKHFPKEFQEVTVMNEDGYPSNRRRNTGRQYKVRGHMMDNSNVVPPVLPATEVWVSHQCGGDLWDALNKVHHKYIYKGHDRTTMEFGKDKMRSAISQCTLCHAPEAFWGLTRNEIPLPASCCDPSSQFHCLMSRQLSLTPSGS